MAAKSHAESQAFAAERPLADRTHDALALPKRTPLKAGTVSTGGVRANETQPAAVLPNETHDAQVLAAELFDEALRNAGIETGEAAFLFGVSESLVRRMRSKDARERVSFVQLLKLPIGFHIELHRAMNRHYGFGRAALRRVLDDLGSLALLSEGA